jgi:hypothetical protein
MIDEIPEDKLHLDHLRADYEDAFDMWAQQLRRLQAIIGSSSNSVLVKEAERRVVAAERAYRRSRDRLTEGLVQAYGEALSCVDDSSAWAAL